MSFSDSKGVFSRRQADSEDVIISSALYNLLIGLTLCWGFAINLIIVREVPADIIFRVSPLVFIIGYFVSCFFGIYLFNSSKKPLVSFIGYNFVVVPFGLIVNMVVSRYDPMLVQDAIFATGIITAMMMIAGTIFPSFFKRIMPSLTIALICVILFELFAVFILGKSYSIIDWVVAAIFCGYIGYDWGRANQVPKTVDNAIDCAAALYMDIINLFLRILRIMGRRR